MTKHKGFFRKAAEALIELESRHKQRRVDYFLMTHMPGERRKVN